MTAREKFKKGDRVQTTRAFRAMSATQRARSHVGTVVGYGNLSIFVAVVFDGSKTRRKFHMDYIEPEGSK
jgi:hypothetical protein